MFIFKKIPTKEMEELIKKIEKINFNELPDEIINKIINYMDIKDLLKIQLLSKKMCSLAEELFQKKIIYHLKINVHRYHEKLFLRILCNKCLEFQRLNNKYKITNTFYKQYTECENCKYKPISKNFDFKYIKHLIISFYDDNSGRTTPPLSLTNEEKEIYKHLNNFVNNIYDKYNVYISEVNYEGVNDKDYKHDIFSKILNNTKYKAVIIVDSYNYGNNNKEMEIINPYLKILSIPTKMIDFFKKIDIKNIEEIDINDNDIIDNDGFIDFDNEIYDLIQERSNIINKKLLNNINKNLIKLSFTNNLSFNFDKKIKTIDICFDARIDTNMEDIISYLIQIKEKYHIEKILLNLLYCEEEHLNKLNKRDSVYELLTFKLGYTKFRKEIEIYDDPFIII